MTDWNSMTDTRLHDLLDTKAIVDYELEKLFPSALAEAEKVHQHAKEWLKRCAHVVHVARDLVKPGVAVKPEVAVGVEAGGEFDDEDEDEDYELALRRSAGDVLAAKEADTTKLRNELKKKNAASKQQQRVAATPEEKREQERDVKAEVAARDKGKRAMSTKKEYGPESKKEAVRRARDAQELGAGVQNKNNNNYNPLFDDEDGEAARRAQLATLAEAVQRKLAYLDRKMDEFRVVLGPKKKKPTKAEQKREDMLQDAHDVKNHVLADAVPLLAPAMDPTVVLPLGIYAKLQSASMKMTEIINVMNDAMQKLNRKREGAIDMRTAPLAAAAAANQQQQQQQQQNANVAAEQRAAEMVRELRERVGRANEEDPTGEHDDTDDSWSD